MEDRRKTPERRVLHRFEGHRLEEQLLALAYEQIWPVIRERSRRPAATCDQQRYGIAHTRTQAARSA